MSLDLDTLLNRLALDDLPYLEMSGGFMIGLAVGYALKKSLKILLFLLGGMVILLFVLENQHIIVIDKHGLESSISHWASEIKQFALFLKDRVSQYHTSSKLSAGTGFLIGLKAG